MFIRNILLVVFWGLCKHALGQDVNQDESNKPQLTFHLDKSLISIKKYNIKQSDSVLSTQWTYADGKLMKIQDCDNTTTFEYKDNFCVNAISGKTLTKYLFDQYGNLFYQKTTVDSSDDPNPHSRCPTYEFRNYVYQDSMKIFCNGIMSQYIWEERASEKYEYDDKKRLIKVLYSYTYPPDHYLASKKLIYNSEGLHIKTLGNPDDMLGGGRDSTIYEYNSQKQLIKEHSYNVNGNKSINYFYNTNGLLSMVTEVSNSLYDNTYISHYYFEY